MKSADTGITDFFLKIWEPRQCGLLWHGIISDWSFCCIVNQSLRFSRKIERLTSQNNSCILYCGKLNTIYLIKVRNKVWFIQIPMKTGYWVLAGWSNFYQSGFSFVYVFYGGCCVTIIYLHATRRIRPQYSGFQRHPVLGYRSSTEYFSRSIDWCCVGEESYESEVDFLFWLMFP